MYQFVKSEDHPAYQKMEVGNIKRQYDFLMDLIETAADVRRPFLSHHIIRSLNFHAITCLHTNAGEYRPCQVLVSNHTPPAHYEVDALMDDFVNQVNRYWESANPIQLCAHVLWGLNHIHPFINGNGRTARAACYFALCMKAGKLLPGTVILPELIRQNRDEYVSALQSADKHDFQPLVDYLSRLVEEQLASATTNPHAA